MSFDAFLKERLFDPLGMEDTFFNVPADKLDRLLPNQQLESAGRAPRSVRTRPTRRRRMFSGGGGLVSSTMDYLRFSEMVRRGGELDGVRILSPKDRAVHDRQSSAGDGHRRGKRREPAIGGRRPGLRLRARFWRQHQSGRWRCAGFPGEYSWGGAAGTVFWVDPVEEMVVIGMIQLMGSPWPLRRELRVFANQAITESYQE